MTEDPITRLTQVHPDLEIWWDSSPLVYDKWAEKMVQNAPPEKRPALQEQLQRLYNTQDPVNSIVRGCTTNPPLSLTAIKSDPDFWDPWIDELIYSHPDLTTEELAWLTYKEVVKRGAAMMLPIWEASGGRYGWI
ncbi:MAG TPA: hypothetical protein PK607_09515, partial [Aggregatilineales bacterium]|nr:hypothetical protein [Aggregatilineales bacterium]